MEKNNKTPPKNKQAVVKEEELTQQENKSVKVLSKTVKRQNKAKALQKSSDSKAGEKNGKNLLEKLDSKEKIKQALIKKALGYTHNEIVEEYVFSEEGEVKLSKRKVTKKFAPPDIPAAKILLKEFEERLDIEQMTEEELEKEKQRLLKQLKEL